nr:unnamed protein product [Callosobruchus analis]
MFGGKPKIGLETSNIPVEAINAVTTEEDLENVLDSIYADNAEIEKSQQSEGKIVRTQEITDVAERILTESDGDGPDISYPI